FSTSQWAFKKAFLDSAQVQYRRLEQRVPPAARPTAPTLPASGKALKMSADRIKGGILLHDRAGRLLTDTSAYRLFEPLYFLGTQPMRRQAMTLLGTRSHKRRGRHTIEQTFSGANCARFVMRCTHHTRSQHIDLQVTMEKKAIREKESLHIALPLGGLPGGLAYNGGLHYPESQLPGSNREFICIEDSLSLATPFGTWQMQSADIALIEIGKPIDETSHNGVKIWARHPQQASNLFLYVLNNYWHTNYKADQAGNIQFTFSLQLK
ncbi:MAG TPA: hypothetical protein PKD78_13450, partial [Saprospiraceae bacterium]|nr:hypothetical protein [Saprospiraceae bacterium]